MALNKEQIRRQPSKIKQKNELYIASKYRRGVSNIYRDMLKQKANDPDYLDNYSKSFLEGNSNTTY